MPGVVNRGMKILKIRQFIIAACVLAATAQAETIDIPASEIGWVADGEPFEAPRAVRAFFHNPAVASATSLTGLEIDVQPSGGTDYYQMRLMRADGAGALTGEVAYAVDGETVLTRTLSPMGGSAEDETPLIAAMKTGERLTVMLPGDDSVSLPLAGFADALSPPAVDQAAAMRSTSIGNQCVQREGGFNYLCSCLPHEFVLAYSASGPAQAYDAADAKCRANIAANPLLGELSVQEALLGARLEPGSAPAAGAKIGALSKDGPAYAAGMRTGDIITKEGSASGERLLQAKPVRPGMRALTVYSPSTDETRVVRVQFAVPPADIKMATHAGFSAAAAAPAEPAAEPAPAKAAKPEPAPEAASAPQAEKISYADPIGESCAGDARMSGLYDCACIAEKAVPARAAIADEQFASQQRLVPRRQAGVEQARKAVADATTDSQKRSAEAMLKRAEDALQEVMTRPAPSDINESAVGLRIYDEKSCKKADFVRDKELKDCKAAASMMAGVTDVESFCACSADKAAQAWLSSDQPYSSKIAVSLATQARQACR